MVLSCFNIILHQLLILHRPSRTARRLLPTMLRMFAYQSEPVISHLSFDSSYLLLLFSFFRQLDISFLLLQPSIQVHCFALSSTTQFYRPPFYSYALSVCIHSLSLSFSSLFSLFLLPSSTLRTTLLLPSANQHPYPTWIHTRPSVSHCHAAFFFGALTVVPHPLPVCLQLVNTSCCLPTSSTRQRSLCGYLLPVSTRSTSPAAHLLPVNCPAFSRSASPYTCWLSPSTPLTGCGCFVSFPQLHASSSGSLARRSPPTDDFNCSALAPIPYPRLVSHPLPACSPSDFAISLLACLMALVPLFAPTPDPLRYIYLLLSSFACPPPLIVLLITLPIKE